MIATGCANDLAELAGETRLANGCRAIDRCVRIFSEGVVDESVETAGKGVGGGGIVPGEQLVDAGVAAQYSGLGDGVARHGGVSGLRADPTRRGMIRTRTMRRKGTDSE